MCMKPDHREDDKNVTKVRLQRARQVLKNGPQHLLAERIEEEQNHLVVGELKVRRIHVDAFDWAEYGSAAILKVDNGLLVHFFSQFNADEALEGKIGGHQEHPSFACAEINKCVLAQIFDGQRIECASCAFWAGWDVGVVGWICFPAFLGLIGAVG